MSEDIVMGRDREKRSRVGVVTMQRFDGFCSPLLCDLSVPIALLPYYIHYYIIFIILISSPNHGPSIAITLLH